MPRSPASWTLAGRAATGTRDDVRVALDLTAPADGLVVTGADGCTDRLLGVLLRTAAAAAPTDCWLRGHDLTAVYEPDDPRRLRATALWRSRPESPPAWELVLSAQTALTESDAALAISSAVAGDRVFAAGVGGRWRTVDDSVLAADDVAVLVRRGPGASSSVLVAVHPGDARRVTLRRGDGVARIECGVFSSVIEKGVLLRSRVLAAVGPAREDEGWATPLVAEFAASPPVLQT